MGGLHIVGTERHDSRRIDNQLRGRAGRQGDPGSPRFYLSLQDDLMRIFAGEWVGNVLTRLGMKEGEAIESRMVSGEFKRPRRKSRSTTSTSRKNLLEYDEVMDHAAQARSTATARKSSTTPTARSMIMEMIDEQVDQAAGSFPDDPTTAPESFREFASNRLGVEMDDGEFRR